MRGRCRTRPFRFAAFLFSVLAAGPLAAQEREGLSLELSGDGAGISIHGQDSEWWMGRAQLSAHRTGRGGGYLAVESLRRFGMADTALVAGGHFHGGRWTIAGQAGVGPRADFYYRATTEVELSRDLGAGWVVHASHRYLDFRSANVQLVSPAVTWYAPRGELQLRTYLGRNTTLRSNSWSILARGGRDVSARWRLGGGLAVGERLFDVTSLAGEPARGWLAFAEARRRIGSRASVGAHLRLAHEDPGFRQVGLAIDFATSLP